MITGQTSGTVSVPIIASGGAGTAAHVVEAFEVGADAALLAGALHDGTLQIADVKTAMLDAGMRVRPVNGASATGLA